MQVVVPVDFKDFWQSFYFNDNYKNNGFTFIDYVFPYLPLWKSTKQYFINDLVRYNGKIYVCLQNNIGKDPSDQINNSSYWFEKGNSDDWFFIDPNSVIYYHKASLYKPYEDGEANIPQGSIRCYENNGIVFDFIAAMDNPTKNPIEGSLFDTQWVEIGLSNIFAPFDDKTNTKLNAAQQYRFKIAPITDINTNELINPFENCDFIGFFGIEGVSQISMTIKPPTQCSDTSFEAYFVDLRDIGVADWYEFYFSDIRMKDKAFIKIPPLLKNQELFFTILPTDTYAYLGLCGNNGQSFTSGSENWGDGATRNFKIGSIIFGKTIDLGVSVYNPSFTVRSNFKYERDQFGYIRTVEKTNKWTDLSIPVMIDTDADVDRIRQTLEYIKDKQCVFIGDERDDGFDSLMILGFVNETTVPITPKKTTFNLEIKGAI